MNKTERTAALISNFKGLRDEFEMLKGVLCMGHAFDSLSDDSKLINVCFDNVMIAKRMDMIRNGK